MHLSRRRASAALAVLALFLFSCVSASGVRLGRDTFEPRAADHPIVVYDAFDGLAGYRKVGKVVGEGSDLHGFAAIVERMKERARQFGGDALVLTGGGLLLSAGGPDGCGIDVDRTVQGTVIRFEPR